MDVLMDEQRVKRDLRRGKRLEGLQNNGIKKFEAAIGTAKTETASQRANRSRFVRIRNQKKRHYNCNICGAIDQEIRLIVDR